MLEKGHQVRTLREINLASLVYKDLTLSSLSSETKNPYRLHLDQYVFCQLILKNLKNISPGIPGSVLWGHELVEICDNPDTQDEKPIQIKLNRPDLSPDQLILQAKWLIAADGSKSTVRSLLNVPFEGEDIMTPVVRMIFKQLPQVVTSCLEGLTYARHPSGNMSALRMPDGWRIILRPKREEMTAALTNERWGVQKLAELFAEILEPSIWNELPIQKDYYNVAQRYVKERKHRRCLLIGDAAHVTNTRGGLNMNFGLLEGLELAESIGLSTNPFQTLYPDTMDSWACRWAALTQSILIPRTARLLHTNTPFLAHDETWSLNALKGACLLDIPMPPES